MNKKWLFESPKYWGGGTVDIRCPICGEPWDADCIHEEVNNRFPNLPWPHGKDYKQEEYDKYYLPVLHDFRKNGCAAFGNRHNTIADKKGAQLTDMLFDILGDDVDGLASELEDAEYMGYI